MKHINTRNFWLLMATLFVMTAVKAHSVGDNFAMWLTGLCAVCGVIHAFARAPEQITLRKSNLMNEMIDQRAGRDCSFFRKKRPNQLIYLVNSTL